MISARKRSRVTGPASYKRAKLSNAVQSSTGTYQVRSTVPASYRRRVELKQIAVNQVGFTPGVAGVVREICINIPLGDDYNQREGRTVKLLDCHWGVEWLVAAASVGSAEFALRIVVVVWNQESVPTVSDILASGNILSEYNIQTAPKYRVLSDRTYSHATNLATQNFDQVIQGRAKINQQQNYPGGATPDALTGKVYALFIANNSPATATMRAATRYVEI